MRLFSRRKNDITFRHLSGITHTPHDVAAVVEIYRQIFGQDPWNEGYRCPECKSVYSLNYSGNTCDCEGKILLVPFWPTGKVTEDFYGEMRNPGSKCVIAESSEDGIIGFAWGYHVTIDDHFAEKVECPNIGELLHGSFFYVDEVGLLLKYRSKGYGQELHDALVANEQRAVYRTLNNCTMHRIGTKKGYKDIAHISSNRVIVARY